MTANITSLADYKATQSPHLSGHAKCLDCKHEWVAVAPVGTTALECPQCETYRGVWKGQMTVDSGRQVLVCNCGNDTYQVLRDGVLCVCCGVKTSYEALCDA